MLRSYSRTPGRMPRALFGLLTLAALALAVPSAASAATVGQTAATSGDVVSCGGATLFVSPSTTYTAPRSGVLTSWSVQGDNADSGNNGEQLELKVVRPLGGTNYRIVGEDPTTRAIDLNALNTFDVQIPVRAGNLLALWVGPTGTHPCSFVGPGGPLAFRAGDQPEPAIGDTFETDSTTPTEQLNASANLVTKKCNGKAPTIVGTSGSDTLRGTSGKDVIVGLAGNDTLKGRGGKDRLCGNKGDDTLKGGPGDDTCVGGPGNDTARKCETKRSI